MKTTLGLIVSLTIAIVAVLGEGTRGTAAAADQTATTVRLESGLNYVGWISEPTDVASFFSDVPQAELVYAWDAAARRYRFAAPNGLGTLRTLSPGAGLAIRIGGGQGIDWVRPQVQRRPIIQLVRGWNFVAWSGAEGTALAAATDGLGSSLLRSLSPNRERTLALGSPIWIEARAAVRWIQDPAVIPDLLFPGGASVRVRESTAEDVLEAVEFYVERFGLVVPGMTFYFPLNCEALSADALPQHADRLRATCGSVTHLAASAWAGPDYIVAVRHEGGEWYDPSITPGESNLELFTHEYAHSLQMQLAQSEHLRAPIRLVEGMAEWLGFWRRIDAIRSGETVWGVRERPSERPAWNAERGLAGEPHWDAERGGWRRELFDSRTPTLRSAEQRGGSQLAYELGVDAVELLVQRAGPESLFAFWRALEPAIIGPDRSWRSRLDWRAAFEAAFGLSAERFYDDFEAWREAQTEGREFTRLGFDVVQGRLLDASGEPLVNAKVQFVPERGWGSRGQYSYTGENGTFTTIASHHDWEYKVEITLENGCRAHYGDGGWTATSEAASPLAVDWIPIEPGRVSGSLPGEEYALLGIDGQRHVALRMPSALCESAVRRIRGVVQLSESEPLAGIAVRWHTADRHGEVQTDLEGAFELSGGDGERFRIFVDLAEGCVFTHENWGYVEALFVDEATNVRVDGGDVELIPFNVPLEACR